MKTSPLLILILLIILGVVIFVIVKNLASEDSDEEGEKEESFIRDIDSDCVRECTNKLPSAEFREACAAGETDNCTINSIACNNGVIGTQPGIIAGYHAQIAKVSDGYLISGDSLANGCVTSNITGVASGPYCPGAPSPPPLVATLYADNTIQLDAFGTSGSPVRQLSYAKIGVNSGTDHLSDEYYPRYPLNGGVYPVLGSIGGVTEALFLMNDGTFWTVGDPNHIVQDLVNAADPLRYQPWRQRPEIALPVGVEACNAVVMLSAATRNSGNGLAGVPFDPTLGTTQEGAIDGFSGLLTDTGNLYLTGPGVDFVDPNADEQSFAASSPVNALSGIQVADFAISVRHLFVLSTDGNLYASGYGIYDGANPRVVPTTYPVVSAGSDPLTPVALTGLPVDVAIVDIQVSTDGSANASWVLTGPGSYAPVYHVLLEDGTVWSMGQNHFGMLGINREYAEVAESLTWVQVQEFNPINTPVIGVQPGPGVDGPPLQNVLEISTSGTNNRFSNAVVIVDDPDNGINRQVRVWGYNVNVPTSAALGTIGLPLDFLIVTGALEPQWADPSEGSNIIEASAGGHITPVMRDSGLICNVGHNVSSAMGAFGDGTFGSRGEYFCVYNPVLAGQSVCNDCETIEPPSVIDTTPIVPEVI